MLGAAITILSGSSAVIASEPANARFRRLSVEDGLRHNVVYSLTQDSAGFIWLATEGGLVRYDGHDFVHFDHHPFREQTASSQDASFIFQDDRDRLWIGTWGGGLDLFDLESESFVHFRHDQSDPASLSDDRVQSVFQDRSDRIWIATFKGLNLLLPEALEKGLNGAFQRILHNPQRPSSLPHDRVWKLSEDLDGGLWLATEAGVSRLIDLDSASFETFRHDPDDPASLSNDNVRVVYHDSAGTLWVGTHEGLNRLDPETGGFKRYLYDPDRPGSLAHDIINVVYEDSHGSLWIGTLRGGLCRWVPETDSFVTFAHDPLNRWSLSHQDVRALWEDRTGILWIGTRGGGASLLDLEQKPFELFAHKASDPQSLSDPVVLSIWEDTDRSVWVGTMNGLNRIGQDERIERFMHDSMDPLTLSDSRIQSIIRDANDDLWVGTYEGLNRLEDDGSFTRIFSDPENPSSLASNRIQAMLLSDQTLWIGTRAGLHKYDDELQSFERFRADPDNPQALADDFIWTLARGREGSIWIGTDVGGLHQFDPKTGIFERYQYDPSRPTGLSNNRVRAVWEDTDGSVWVGTRQGLNRLNPERTGFDHWFETDGLPNASIHGLIVDDTGALWLSSNGGLARLDPASGRIWSFDENDGLQGKLFSRHAYHRGPSGRMFFGGTEGLNIIEPALIERHHELPPVVLTDLQVGGHDAELDRAFSALEMIELEHTDNSFSFEFAALDYARPIRHEYGYILEGFDPDWSASGERRVAFYTNVDPGDYVFKVRLANRDGDWSDPQLELRVLIAPPWWQRGWTRLGGLLILGGALFAGYRIRIRRMLEAQRHLEEKVSERTAVVERQKAHLQTVSQIVRVINAELEYSSLLMSILDGVAFLEGADTGLALVLDPSSKRYELAAASGWVGSQPKLGFVDLADIDAYIGDSEELTANVHVGPPADSSLRYAELHSDRAPAVSLVMRIVVEEEIVGFLIFGRIKVLDPAFADLDPQTLEDLHEHVASAFVRGRLLDHLRLLNHQKNEFLGIAAHDLRSPLNGIIGYVDLLRRFVKEKRFEDAPWDRFLGHIRSAATEMLDHIGGLLDVTVIETGKIDLEIERHSLDLLIEDRAEIHRSYAWAKDIEVELVVAEPNLEVDVDKARIGEVIDNLLSNAIKFTSNGGTVRIDCLRRDDEVLTEVSDTGQGLNENELAQVFSGKKLSARPTAGEASTGLGLVIVKRLIDLHGGRLWVESKKGKGSTFGFALPKAR